MRGIRAQRRLRPGDVVEVRSADEILATLDPHAASQGLPFMPEMLQYVGKRFTVSRRVEKICDTVSGAYGSRRMRDTVYLENLRCDGSAHGGCQARCRIYWREEWLKRVDDTSQHSSGTSLNALQNALAGTTRPVHAPNGPSDLYRCQATDALIATAPLKTRDVRQYIREVTSGNVSLPHAVRVLLRALVVEVKRRRGRYGTMPLQPVRWHLPTQAGSEFQPGDAVMVRSTSEIAATLDARGMTRGLFFDWEMVPHCGARYHVQERIQRMIDERNGQMLEFSNDCLVLRGVVCSGEHSFGRWFCPRAIHPYWREAWLRRPDDAEVQRPAPQ